MVACQPLLHSSEVHGLLDEARVLMQPHLFPVDRLREVHGLGAFHDTLEHAVAFPQETLIHGIVHKAGLGTLVTVLRERAGQHECYGERCGVVSSIAARCRTLHGRDPFDPEAQAQASTVASCTADG